MSLVFRIIYILQENLYFASAISADFAEITAFPLPKSHPKASLAETPPV